jgi:RNA polymerase sigma factor (sigma-70 family)
MTTSHARGHAASLHECALLDAAQHDDWHAQEELLRRYERLIRATVRKLRLPCRCDYGDIAQEARIGLLAAIRGWQPNRGPFRAFAATCVRGQALKALDRAGARKHQLLSRALSLEATARVQTPPDTGEARWASPFHQLVDATSRRADPVATLLAREQLDGMLTVLPALTVKERAALTGELNGKSQQQLAEEQGSTRKAVKAALRRARDKLSVQMAPAT